MSKDNPSTFVMSTVKIVLSKFKVNEDVTIYEMEMVGKSHNYKAHITEKMYKTMKGRRKGEKKERGEFVVIE